MLGRFLPARSAPLLAVAIAVLACTRAVTPATTEPAPEPAQAPDRSSSPIERSTQLVLVETPSWDATTGTLRRYERASTDAAWRPAGGEVPVVVGAGGLGWDDARPLPAGTVPIKREGDNRSPAGAFAIDTAFGFAERPLAGAVHLPYVPLVPSTECVDDARSVHYNTIVDRERVPRVDWTSAEHMRRIEQYALGLHVAYNAPPRAGRGSCIFLHIWAGPSSVTAGCTAMEADALRALTAWLEPARRPMLVQLPSRALAQMRERWALP
jgi:D-alanyl-D-alanine dipeptidase